MSDPEYIDVGPVEVATWLWKYGEFNPTLKVTAAISHVVLNSMVRIKLSSIFFKS